MLEQGLNPPSIDKLLFKSSYLMLTIKTGIITGILSLTEGIAVGRTFASLKDYQIDGNKEMMAIGIMNIAGSCSSCFITTGSFSRSAVNYNSGSKTAISNLVMASVVLITMMFLMPLFYYTPNVILAVTIILAVVGLIDFKVPIKLWKVDKIDFIAYLTAFIGVLFISVPIGLAIAVGISVIKILLPVTRPNIAIMGNVLGTQSYRSIGQYRDAKRVPYLLILSIEFPIYFASAVYLQDRILRWVREEEERALMLKENGIKCVVLDMSAVTAIDISGIDALLEIKKALSNRSLQLVLANPIGEVANKLFISEAWEKFGSDNIYMNVAEAVAAITKLIKSQQ
ncbi:putative sulfate transporter 3.4 [Dendrobium catenatum]|uniref:Putative sulfate transporter 3.4 n=2 Tax=Dendrobium catenatum TaxID=906689 RepID=A0A2I0W7P8_9ASPA|nr:putative sulfate transporter 3.4 [Dendrobium catenatum]